jgi:hypothetical protein
MFWTVPLSVIRSFSLYTQQWYTSYQFADSLQDVSKTVCIVVCTVKNSWWWTEELSKTCRVSVQNKFEKLVHLVGFIVRTCHNAWSHECKILGGKVALCLIKHDTMEMYVWLEVQLQVLTSALNGDGQSASCTDHFHVIPRETAASTPWIRGWLSCRACLDVMVTTEMPAPGKNWIPFIHPVGQSLYWY